MKKLSPRQWELYRFIKSYSREGKWMNRRAIQLALPHLYPVLNANVFNDKNARLITSDVQAINDCDLIKKIILSDSYKGLKMATATEIRIMLDREEINILKSLNRHHRKRRKARLNNQGRMKFSKYQKEYIESFVEEVKDGKTI